MDARYLRAGWGHPAAGRNRQHPKGLQAGWVEGLLLTPTQPVQGELDPHGHRGGYRGGGCLAARTSLGVGAEGLGSGVGGCLPLPGLHPSSVPTGSMGSARTGPATAQRLQPAEEGTPVPGPLQLEEGKTDRRAAGRVAAPDLLCSWPARAPLCPLPGQLPPRRRWAQAGLWRRRLRLGEVHGELGFCSVSKAVRVFIMPGARCSCE